MRISHLMTQRQISNDMAHARSVRNAAASQISSGKRITRLSDDPASAIDSLRARREIQRSQMYELQAQDAQGFLDNYDGIFTQFSDRLIRARDVALQGQNTGASGAEIRKALSDEISAIKTELLSLSNAKYAGKPMFAGTADPAKAYDDTTLAYQGDSGQYKRNIAPGVDLPVSVTGPEAFGSDGSGSQMFEVLDDLEAQILAGNEAGIASGILSLDVARERLESMRISVGVRTSTLEAIRTQRAVATETLTRQASAAEDADLAKSAIELSSAEVAYNATLSVAARIFQTSLVDFLR